MAIASAAPTEIMAGDKVEFTQNYADYLPSEWTLFYVLVNQSQRYSFQASDNGDGQYLISISSAATTAIEPGEYRTFIYVEKDDDRITVLDNKLIVNSNYTSVGYDPRSHAKKVLDALESLLENKATDDQLQVMINGRSITHLSPEELIKWRDRYRSEYFSEQRRERIKKGLSHRGKIKVRFRG